MRKAQEAGEEENLEGLIASIGVPSQKEWYKLIRSLIFSSIETGILRAHDEIADLMVRYKFNEGDFTRSRYGHSVIFPKEARDFLEKYALELSVVTDETLRARITETLKAGLEEGISNKELFERIQYQSLGTVSEWHSRTIARTENSKMYNAGRITRYTDPDLAGFVQALQYTAILDTRTTEVCIHLDSRIISIDNQEEIAKFTPPNHFQCRSTWLPVTQYEDWTDNWDSSVEPESNFEFTSPVPKLLKGKTEPLVKANPNVVASKLGPDDVSTIKALESDDDFVTALKNIDDLALKESLVRDRGRMMFERDYKGVWQEVPFARTKINTDMRHPSVDKAFPYKKGRKSYLDFTLNDQRWFIQTTQKDYDDDRKFMYKLFADYNTKAGSADLGVDGFLDRLDEMKELYDTGEKVDLKKIKLIDEFKRIIKEAHRPKAGQIKLKSLDAFGAPISTKNSAKVKQGTKDIRKIVPSGGESFVKNFDGDPNAKAMVQEAYDFMQKFYSPRLIPKQQVTIHHHGTDDFRAFARPHLAQIHSGKFAPDEVETLIHEVAHVLHNSNRDVEQLIRTFFKRRTAGEEAQIMYEAMNGRGQLVKEYGIPDDFSITYMGRVYVNESDIKNAKAGLVTASLTKGEEILSMGLQKMYRNPGKFYREDPDYFGFVYAIMKGVF